MRSTNQRFQLPLVAYLFTLIFVFTAVDARAQYADLNCDNSSDVFDVQLLIMKALGLPFVSDIDANQDGIHDDCPLSPCGSGTVFDPLTQTCVVDGTILEQLESDANLVGLIKLMEYQHKFIAECEKLGPFNNEPLCKVNLLTDINASGVDLSGENLSKLDFSGSDLSKTIFVGTDLTQAHLDDANLTDTDLTGADLTQAYLYDADLTGADLTESTWDNTNAVGADLTGADLTNVFFKYSNLCNVDLTDADLTGVTWSGSVCPNCTLAGYGDNATCCDKLNGAVPAAGCE